MRGILLRMPPPDSLAPALAIQGWMEPHELAWLATVAARSKLIVEVGAWKGRTTRVLTDHCAGTVLVVDNWCDAREAADQRNGELSTRGAGAVEAEWHENLGEELAFRRVELLRGNSPDMAIQVADRPAAPDFIFIDADHSVEGVRADIRAYEVLVQPGGIIAGHDYSTDSHPGVRVAVDEHFGPLVRRGPGSIWWVRV